MSLQGTPCTALTLIHHAADALVYGRWSEATRLFTKAAERIEAEAAQ